MREQEDNFDEVIGVSKDVDSFPDILARQLSYINQLITGGASQNFIENAISVLEALLSPYLPESYEVECKALERLSVVSLRSIRSDDRYFKEEAVISRFLLKKYAVLLRFAKERGFLPKTLKW